MSLKKNHITYSDIYCLAIFYSERDMYQNAVPRDELCKMITAIAFIESGYASKGKDAPKDLELVIGYGCNPSAKNSGGATGLMQMTDSGAGQVQKNTKIKISKKTTLNNPRFAIFCAINHLSWIYKTKSFGNYNWWQSAKRYNGEPNGNDTLYANRAVEIRNFLDSRGYFKTAMVDIEGTLKRYGILLK